MRARGEESTGLLRRPAQFVLLACAMLAAGLLGSANDVPVAEATPSSTVSYSLELDGSGYVEVPHNSELNLADTGAMTIETWVRRTGPSPRGTIISKGSRTFSYWLGFSDSIHDPKICFIPGGEWECHRVGNTPVPADVWTHIAVVRQPFVEIKYYINGDLDYTGSPGWTPGENTRPVFIGADPDGVRDEFSGNIAEVRLWNVARNQDEIRRTMHVALEEPLPGLVANWHLSGDCRDNIGSHDCTPVGGAYLYGDAAPPRPVSVPVDSLFSTLEWTRDAAATAYIPELDRVLLIGGVLDGAHSRRIDVIDVSTGDHVAQLASLPGGDIRTYASAAYVPENTTAYLFGGSDLDPHTSPGTLFDTIYAIDASGGEGPRRLAATLPSVMSTGAAVYHPGVGKVYVFGGHDGSDRLSSISVFDPDDESESIQPFSATMPVATNYMAAVYSGVTDKIYYFGGVDPGSTWSDAIYEIALDPDDPDGLTGTVSLVTTAVLPQPSGAFTAVEDPVSRLIYLVGGESLAVTVFDPVTGEIWETPVQLPDRRYNPSVVYSEVNRQAVLMGGLLPGAEPEQQSDIWRIPLGDGPLVPLRRWDFPTPVSDPVTAIDGDEKRVLVGTDGSRAYYYDRYGGRGQWGMSQVGWTVNDVRYNAANDEAWIASDSLGAKLDSAPCCGSIDETFLPEGCGGICTRILSIDFQRDTPDRSLAGLFGTEDGLMYRHCYPPPFGCVWLTEAWPADIRAITLREPPLQPYEDPWMIGDHSLWDVWGPTGPAEPYTQVCGLYYDTTTSPQGDLAIDSKGEFWLTSPGYYLDAYIGEGICQVFIDDDGNPTGLPQGRETDLGDRATAVDVDADGRIWVSVESQTGLPGIESGGLVQFQSDGSVDGTRKEEINWLDGPVGSRTLLSSSVTRVWDSGLSAVGAADERVWAGNGDGKLITLAPRWQQLDESNDLDQKVIVDVWTVRGRAFLATTGSLHVLAPDGKTWDNRSVARVWDVLGDSSGRIWVASQTGIRLYTPGGWDDLSDREGTRPSMAVSALAEDLSGRIWIGSYYGLTLFDRDRFVLTFTSANSPLPSDTARVLLVDRDNRLWVGTDSGLAVLDGSDWTVFTTADGLPANDVRDLAQIGDGRIAVSTTAGLTLYDEGSFTPHDPPVAVPADGLPLAVDEQGRLWAGSAVLTGDEWQGYYWTNSGLRSYHVSDNAADGADRVWFSHAPDTGVSVRGTFLPALTDIMPTIRDINPKYGSSGTQITITGSGFGSKPDDVDITVGGAPVEVVRVEDSELVVRLGDVNRTGAVSISVGGGSRTTVSTWIGGAPAFCAEPVIKRFNPTGGNDGVRITIRGTNFDSSAQVTLDGNLHTRVPGGPTSLRVSIEPGDGSGGPVEVNNNMPGCEAARTDSSNDGVGDVLVEFRRIALTLEKIAVNQGIPSTGLVNERLTMVQHYVSRSVPPRSSDQLEFNRAEVTFSDPDGGEDTQTVDLCPERFERLPCGTFNHHPPGPPSDGQLADIAESLNVMVTPQLDYAGWVDVRSRLLNGGTTWQSTTAANLRPNRPMGVMLVPIMRNNYTDADWQAVRRTVEANLGELRNRIWPTGDARFYWSQVYTVDDVLWTEEWTIEIDDGTELYDAGHEMDQARRRWNEHHRDSPAVIALGVVDSSTLEAGECTPGMAFNPQDTEIWNQLILNFADLLCDIYGTALSVVTFGLFGGGCDLEIPRNVAWVSHDGSTPCGGPTTPPNISKLYGHEMGHTRTVVADDAANSTWKPGCPILPDCNHAHSCYDELSGGECNDADTTFHHSKTLYFSPGVTEPVINILGPPVSGPGSTDRFPDEQLGYCPLCPLGSPASAWDRRGKAIMSYACARFNDNVFFEPVDIAPLYQGYASTAVGWFVDSLLPGASPATALSSNGVGATAAGEAPTPRIIPGERLHVSGTVDKAANTGDLVLVEVLGEDAPLDASYASGYWLVQLDGGGGELSRTGLMPGFRVTPAFATVATELDVGFFSATLVREDGVASLELRKDDTVLDTFTPGSASPTVSISSPTGGSYGSGTIAVTWTASDTDGDDLEIAVLYSADGGASWTPAGFCSPDQVSDPPTSCDSGTVDVHVSLLAGSDDARVQVIATDGFNTGSATSAPFSVDSQPPRPFIDAPSDGTTFLEGQRIILLGGAYDNQDGSVADANLRWSSDRDGDLGTGSELGVYLSVGSHTLTLEAENSVGDTAWATVAVTVEGDYDFDGIPDSEELTDGLNPLTEHDAFSDEDGDGLSLITERKRGLDPGNADTDGDGRSDADEVADGTNPLAVDDPLPPDALEAFPDSLTFEGDLSLDVPLPQKPVQIVSREPATWNLTADVQWLSASAATGVTPAGVTILVDAFLLDEGAHTGTLTFSSAELGDAVDVPVTVTITNSGGYFDIDGNGDVTVGDVQEVAARVPSDNSQEGFSYRHDIDRDGDIDTDDGQLFAARWETQRSCCSASYPPSPSTVLLNAPSTVLVGEVFDVDVLIQNAQNLGGFEGDLTYENTVLELQGVTPSALLASSGRVPEVLGPVIDIAAGTVAGGAYTYGGSTLGVSGNGMLVRLTFRAVAESGSSVLGIENVLLADIEGSVTVAPDDDATLEILPTLCDPGADTDGDGFNDFVECYIGTDSLDDCPDDLGSPGLCPGPSCDGDDCWPPDLDVDREADIADVLKFKPIFLIGLPCIGEPGYDSRFDFNANGCINIADVLLYKPIILTECTP